MRYVSIAIDNFLLLFVLILVQIGINRTNELTNKNKRWNKKKENKLSKQVIFFSLFFLNGTKVCLKLKWHRKAANAIRFAVCHQVSSYDGRRSRVERKNNPHASGRYMDTDSRRSFNAIPILLILNHDYCSIYTRLSNDTLFFFFFTIGPTTKRKRTFPFAIYWPTKGILWS